MSRLTDYSRRLFLAASAIVVACMPFVALAEELGWNQRPLHLLQSFVAVPVACVTSGLYLWSRRGQPGEGAMRALSWFVFVSTLLWVVLLAYVLGFADFSVLDQK
jgi:hypothetical protein